MKVYYKDRDSETDQGLMFEPETIGEKEILVFFAHRWQEMQQVLP